MKKIVALGAMAAIAGGMIFAEPVFEPSVTLSGDASVQWGVDLDAGKTGFKNSTGGDFKVKLWGDGSRELDKGDGIWAELKTTGKEATINKGTLEGGAFELNEAKLHFNDFYIGIKSGDTQLGAYKFATAIRGDDGDGSKWIADQGPDKYTQGIVAGYGNDNFGIDVDFRSLEDASTQYTNSYAVAAEAQLKDSNEWVGGLAVKAGAAYQLSNESFSSTAEVKDEYIWANDKDADGNDILNPEKDGAVWTHSKTAKNKGEAGKVARNRYNSNILGYGVSASYKLPVGDYYLKPQVAFAGAISTADTPYEDKDGKAQVGKTTANHNELAFGVMFGFGGDKADNPGVYYLGGDESKKSEPGVGLVVALPLADTKTVDTDKTRKYTRYDKALAYIIPSFYSNGELVENLKVGLYSEIVPLRFENPDMEHSIFDGQFDEATGTLDITKGNFGKTIYSNDDGTDNKEWGNAKDKDGTLAFAVAAGLQYKIEIDAGAITPKFGIRYANAAYVDNGIASASPLKNDAVFKDMGIQAKKYVKPTDADKKTGYSANGASDGDYFNLKAGVDVNVIDNTTFFVEYASANLLNKYEYLDKAPTDADKIAAGNYKVSDFGYYNVKLGTFNIGCKIAF